MNKSILKKPLLSILALSAITSCSKDDGPTITPNTAPVITTQTFNASESASDTDIFGKVAATDPESNTLSFSMKTNSNALFEITTAGNISLASGKRLDFEIEENHTLSIDVSDGKLTSNADITINVVDVDENQAPEFLAQTFTIDENVALETLVGALVATDPDGDTITFRWDPNFSVTTFRLVNNEIQTASNSAGNLNFEIEDSYTVSIIASDGVLTTQADITININDINDAPFMNGNRFNAAEDIDDTMIIGNVDATDEDGDTINYAISADNDGLFEISTIGEISLIAGKNLDFETKTSHTIFVDVSDTNLSTTSEITINVTNVDEITTTVSTFAGSSAGSATNQFNSPIGVAKGPDGNLYVADRLNGAIKSISPSGIVSIFVDASTTPTPRDLVFDSNGNLYITDTTLHSIIKITPSGTATTLAGNGTSGYVDTNSSGASTQFNNPHGLTINANGDIYLADTGNNAIRRIALNGDVITIAGSISSVFFDGPEDVVIASDGSLYISDYNNHNIKKVSPTGNASVFVGDDSFSIAGSIDGIGNNARLNGPAGLAIDANDFIYMASNRNNTIRKINTNTREITTIAGSISRVQGGVDGTGTNARFRNPLGIWVNAAGDEIFVGDNNNHRIRKITIEKN